MKKIIFIIMLAIVTMSIVAQSQTESSFIANIVPFRIFFNGEEKRLNDPVVAINDRTYIPVREASETLGINVDWDGETESIYLNSKKDSTGDIKGSGEELFPVSKNGLYGYINRNGEVKIDFKYVGAEEFSEGLALVHKSGAMDGEYGFINADGEEVIPCIYSDACSFSDGVALVTEANHTENEDWYYIDKNGNRLFDTQYPIMRSFHDGYALVLKEGYGFPVPPSVDIPKKWAYMTKSGELANDMEFDDAYDFSEGYAIVKNNGKWGVIDTDFNLVVDYKYDNIGSGFKNGIVPVYDENNKVLHYITPRGDIIDAEYQE